MKLVPKFSAITSLNFEPVWDCFSEIPAPVYLPAPSCDTLPAWRVYGYNLRLARTSK